MADVVKASVRSVAAKIKELKAAIDLAEKLRKEKLKAITGHEEPLVTLSNLEKKYMNAVKNSDGLVSAKPSTIKALKDAEKKTSKATVQAAVSAITKEVDAAAKEGKGKKEYKKFSDGANVLIDALKALDVG